MFPFIFTSSTITIERKITPMKLYGMMMLCTFSLVLFACQSNTQEKITIKSSKDSISYSIGTDIGKNIRQQEIDVDVNILSRGIKDGLDSAALMLTEEQMKAAKAVLQQEMMKKRTEKMKTEGEKAKAEGNKFLEENKKKDGVITTASGLQYKVITMGTGKKPTTEQTVVVNYRGTLIDGKEFDDTYKRGEPVTYPVNKFVPGWTEALQLMPVGSKWQLFIPSELGYGERGGGQVIPPNATLIFELELLDIK